MAKINVSLPQGTRDFDPGVVRKRRFILDAIRGVFERYGFEPLETPAMENLGTLTGKYGEEGDKLIFKILNNGLGDPKNIEAARLGFDQVLKGRSDKNLTERALRYDLTIPFARYVAMNHAQLVLPFRRYQIQPVWRADRPQKGRYREFYQCDADVVGSTSLLNEVELLRIYQQVFGLLKVPVEIRINSRRILTALAEACGNADKLTDITVAIDKLDKIGLEKVKTELAERGLGDASIAIIGSFLQLTGSNEERLNRLEQLLGAIPEGKRGLQELRYILDFPGIERVSPVLDPTLARGLNYYTGLIVEVKATTVQMGSIGGGGRYDDLTGLFGVPGIPGIGISFGVDRIYDVMEELDLFPEELAGSTRVLFFNLGEQESVKAFGLLEQVRDSGIPAQIYPEQSKFDKQFKYATRKQIPYIAILGSQEMETQILVIKDLRSGKQAEVSWNELGSFNFAE